MKKITNLNQKLNEVFKISKTHEKALKRLNIETLRDLLFTFPVRYSHITKVRDIRDITENEEVTIYGRIISLQAKKTYRTKIPHTEAIIEDRNGDRMKILWFHQAFLSKILQKDTLIRLTGKVNTERGKTMINPETEKVKELPIDAGESLFSGKEKEQFGYPVYRETRGITSKWMLRKILNIVQSEAFQSIEDPLPEYIRERYHLPSLKTALVWIHFPRSKADADAARKRFSFEEIFYIQLRNQQRRKFSEKLPSYRIKRDKKKEEAFINRFPFTPTEDQQSAIETILHDMERTHPMMRLVEGDVGSGKTFVAAVISHTVVQNRPQTKSGREQSFGRLQVAYMAPTEVLATQLFENFIQYFKGTGVQIGLITGKGAKKFPSKTSPDKWTSTSRRQLLSWVKSGEIHILIGTHALIQKSVEFQHLALTVIDEQHRFGTRQRMKLGKKGERIPHYLSMTATPIPRTLALTIYGDLDISVIESMPSGRKLVLTELIPPSEEAREKVYEAIREELNNGRQAYVICPRIEEADPEKARALRVKSVLSEARRLKEKVFPEYRIGIMHSKMKKDEKEKVMKAFYDHEIDILVSTSVVEVGVNVPNATSIIIEGADRFGLAQLHQLRGRVMRSTHQPYCYLFSDSQSERTQMRLKSFLRAKNGFELAEMDLHLRGAGDLAGAKQWGVSDITMESLKNRKLVEYAREEAKNIIEEDETLENFPELKEQLEMRNKELHLE